MVVVVVIVASVVAARQLADLIGKNWPFLETIGGRRTWIDCRGLAQKLEEVIVKATSRNFGVGQGRGLGIGVGAFGFAMGSGSG